MLYLPLIFEALVHAAIEFFFFFPFFTVVQLKIQNVLDLAYIFLVGKVDLA